MYLYLLKGICLSQTLIRDLIFIKSPTLHSNWRRRNAQSRMSRWVVKEWTDIGHCVRSWGWQLLNIEDASVLHWLLPQVSNQEVLFHFLWLALQYFFLSGNVEIRFCFIRCLFLFLTCILAQLPAWGQPRDLLHVNMKNQAMLVKPIWFPAKLIIACIICTAVGFKCSGFVCCVAESSQLGFELHQTLHNHLPFLLSLQNSPEK